MAQPDYSTSRYPVRDDIARCHEDALVAFARPGTWWTGEERLAIAAEARAARDCALCRERKAALSPFAIDGPHDGPGVLGPEVVDVVHRIVTDPGRLTRSWYQRTTCEGALDDVHYVELVSVSVILNALDLFAWALGLEPAPLPAPVSAPSSAPSSAPQAGTPSNERPRSARDEGAWVPEIPAGAAGGEEWRALYGERELVPQIGRALSLVPAEVRSLQAFSGPHYMELDHVGDPRYVTPGRTLDRMQLELIASRVSAINECFY